MAQFLGTVQLGGFYNNGTILKRPTKPWSPDSAPYSGCEVGDIPKMSGSMANYSFGNTPIDTANKLQWHKIKDGDKILLICDRVILVSVSWDALNAQGYVTGKTVTIDGATYRCRVLTGGEKYRGNSEDPYAGGSPTNNEWDRFVTREEAISGLPAPLSSDLDKSKNTTDLNSAHNQFWNWFGIGSLCKETYYIAAASMSSSTYRGQYSARYKSGRDRTSGSATVGFRPVLEALNAAPTAPTSIDVPAGIEGGGSVTVSWAAGSDPDGNLEGYKLERSTDGGDTWTQVYQGAGTSAVCAVAFGTETVMFRVRAYDSQGEHSGWRTSGQVTVINNTAPGDPSSITVPMLVLGGGPLTVAWGPAQDVDDDLAGYALERQADGGTWTEVYRGEALSFTDTITRGWATVAYRVRAYDGHGAYSGYTASTAREVNNNAAPVIQCGQESGADLGTVSEGFSIDYSASDTDGDAVAVTEAVDGRPLRQFTAGAGQTYTAAVTGETFMKLLNGAHTLTVTASDGKAEAVHPLTFTKLVTAASVTLAEPMEADAPITICVLSVTGHIPEDAAYHVKVTNNANDEAPVWEDCTAEVKNGGNHIFANETAANGFAFNFKVTAERGESGEGGYINSVQGGFQ